MAAADFVYNVTPWIGIKADFAGYTQGSGLKNQLTNLATSSAT